MIEERTNMSTIVGQIFVGNKMCFRHGIPNQRTIQVRVGCLVVASRLVIGSPKGKTYMLSPELYRALHITRGHRLRFRYDQQNNMIHLGPTLGILTTSLPNREDPIPTGVQAELVYLSHIGRTVPGQVYIFTPGSINWANYTVRGFHYRNSTAERGIWVSAKYPLPDVIYDRIPSRKAEATAQVRETKQRLQDLPFIKYFNPAFLNKWQVYQMMLENHELGEYMPETRALHLADLEVMLERYQVVFLKPCNGSLGKGIIRVRHGPEGRLQYVIHRTGRLHGSADNPRELLAQTVKARRGKAYIVQEGLDLMKYRGSAFDIRIIYQKNGSGAWQIGKKFVRVAPGGSSISNLSRGGKPEMYKRLMRNLFTKSQTAKTNLAINDLCQKVAAVLDKQPGVIYGELGLDIGLGRQGQPYLIEVNSKPRKTTESEASQAIVRNTFRRPVEYAFYLAGFPVR